MPVLWIGDVGITGINAVVDILAGNVNPSGSLVDTYCYDNYSSPAMANFTPMIYEGYTEELIPEKAKSYMVYQEGIYVGYKYYETASDDGVINYEDVVKYPFGYGLSYTTFEQKMNDFSDNGDNVTFNVTVTNTRRCCR